MAANPKLPPDDQNRRDDHAHVVLTRKRTNAWPIILVIIVAVILIALIVWVVTNKSRTPANPAHEPLVLLASESSVTPSPALAG
jgi:hypothetical protein